MDGWPGYWPGLPPMHYATHCVGPVLGLGRHETTHLKFRNSDLSAQVYRSLFDVHDVYSTVKVLRSTDPRKQWNGHLLKGNL